MRKLTPYDTGERLEPKLWVGSTQGVGSQNDRDDWGKVDFDNDESSTELTIYVEDKGGDLVVHIYSQGGREYTIDIDDQDLRFEVPA